MQVDTRCVLALCVLVLVLVAIASAQHGDTRQQQPAGHGGFGEKTKTHAHKHEGHDHTGGRGYDEHRFGGKDALDVEHTKSYLNETIDVTKNLTQEQMLFYYFKMHDLNNDTLVDGLEMLKVIINHIIEELQEMQARGEELPEISVDTVVDLVDNILLQDDLNNDGAISFAEFVYATHKRAEQTNEAEAAGGGQQQQPQPH